VTPIQLRRIRTRLVTFAEDLFQSIPRKDQRHRGQTYLRGLLLDGKRKSIQPMAARLARGDPAADAYALEQALQQFVNQSPWDPVSVRQRLAERMTAAIGPQAWVIDDTGFPKFGRHSVGELPVRWLLAEWPHGAPEPVKYWLASLPQTTPLERLVGLAKLRWRVEHDYRELKDALGLDHFEGRSFKGWHHHVTLVSVAHAFVTLERLDPKAAASA